MNGIYEKIAQKHADKVIYICDEQKNFMLSHYRNKEELEKKAMIIPLNYIKDWHIYSELISTKEVKNTPKVVSHFGRIYGLRKIDVVLKALKELKEEIPHLEELIVFKQYGQILDRYLKMVKEYKLENIFKSYDRISYQEVMEKMKNSDVLALYDTFVDNDEIQPYLPSKSLEYLLLKKDLFIIAQKSSPTYRIFRAYGYTCNDNDVEEVKKRIKEIIYRDNKVYTYDVRDLENEVAVKTLKDYVDEIMLK